MISLASVEFGRHDHTTREYRRFWRRDVFSPFDDSDTELLAMRMFFRAAHASAETAKSKSAGRSLQGRHDNAAARLVSFFRCAKLTLTEFNLRRPVARGIIINLAAGARFGRFRLCRAIFHAADAMLRRADVSQAAGNGSVTFRCFHDDVDAAFAPPRFSFAEHIEMQRVAAAKAFAIDAGAKSLYAADYSA